MRSPPTSRASAAMSSVDVMTFSCPLAARAAPRAAVAAMNCRRVILMIPLKWVRSVRADAELQLEQQLIRRADPLILSVSILGADLAELARPVGHQNGLLPVLCSRTEDPVGLVDAHSGEPAARELIVARCIEAKSFSQALRLLAMMPD